jgi:hypothetical protein
MGNASGNSSVSIEFNPVSGRRNVNTGMPYKATVIPIMIASPGDVLEGRNIARDVINEWNYVNSFSEGTVLMPVGWETHSSPELSGRPQQLINDPILKKCDLLVGIFWTRVGTPTDESISGSVEEIERHLKAGKPVMVYFSTAPVSPQSLDQTQFAELTKFKTWCHQKGLIEAFDNLEDFRQKFTRQLPITLKENPYLKHLLEEAAASGADVFGGATITATSPPTGASLSQEAEELLLEATLGRSGNIMKLAFLGGRAIQSNGKTFGDSGDRRSMARWEYALDQLVAKGLVVPRGDKGQLFEVTQPGYEMADAIRAQKS